LQALHVLARKTKRSVADLVREAIRKAWLTPSSQGPVALWKKPTKHTAVDHDSIYDNV